MTESHPSTSAKHNLVPDLVLMRSSSLLLPLTPCLHWLRERKCVTFCSTLSCSTSRRGSCLRNVFRLSTVLLRAPFARSSSLLDTSSCLSLRFVSYSWDALRTSFHSCSSTSSCTRQGYAETTSQGLLVCKFGVGVSDSVILRSCSLPVTAQRH